MHFFRNIFATSSLIVTFPSIHWMHWCLNVLVDFFIVRGLCSFAHSSTFVLRIWFLFFQIIQRKKVQCTSSGNIFFKNIADWYFSFSVDLFLSFVGSFICTSTFILRGFFFYYKLFKDKISNAFLQEYFCNIISDCLLSFFQSISGQSSNIHLQECSWLLYLHPNIERMIFSVFLVLCFFLS